MTEIVYPNDTNPMGILQGGRMVHWMDTAAAICAQNHAENICVTASIDSVKFKAPARVGNIVTIKAKVTRSFHSSMEILVEAWSKEVITQEVQLINEAYFTFVAINSLAKPTNVPVLVPGNQLEKEQFEFAEIRKKHRITQK
jgi:acyl-CoA hydrolase